MSRKQILILILVLVVHALLGVYRPGGLMAYALPSLCWGLLALTTLWVCGLEKIRLWFSKQLSVMAAIIAIFQIFILMDAGIFTGFGKSPLLFTPLGITINLVLVSTTLLGTELSRAYLIKNYNRKRPLLTLGLVTLLYSQTITPITGLLTLNEPLAIAQFLGTGVLPALAESLLASYLALLAGPIASIAYLAPLKAFQWFSPVLPNLSWGIEALLGVVPPTIGFLYIDRITPPSLLRRVGIPTEAKQLFRFTRAKKSSKPGWTTISILCVFMVWTTTGLLGFYPTVILSGSMRPTMDIGDIAIVIQTPIEKIKLGDVIQYWQEREMVIHRVYDTYEMGSTRFIITKGDANTAPDVDPIFPAQIRGRLIFIVPKLGWISIYVKTTIAGIWSFFSANIILVYATLTIAAFMASVYMIHAYKSRSTRRWRSLHGRRGWLRR